MPNYTKIAITLFITVTAGYMTACFLLRYHLKSQLEAKIQNSTELKVMGGIYGAMTSAAHETQLNHRNEDINGDLESYFNAMEPLNEILFSKADLRETMKKAALGTLNDLLTNGISDTLGKSEEAKRGDSLVREWADLANKKIARIPYDTKETKQLIESLSDILDMIGKNGLAATVVDPRMIVRFSAFAWYTAEVERAFRISAPELYLCAAGTGPMNLLLDDIYKDEHIHALDVFDHAFSLHAPPSGRDSELGQFTYEMANAQIETWLEPKPNL